MKVSYRINTSIPKGHSGYLVSIDGHRYIDELWDELNTIGCIDRLKDIPQLGNIPVKAKYRKTRYDYVMLQLYLHQFVQINLNNKLKYSYSNTLNYNDLGENIYMTVDGKDLRPSLADAIQVFVLVYNIGHFYNTFTASMAITETVNNCLGLREKILEQLSAESRVIAEKIIDEKNYHRYHLVNSLILLEKCDTTKSSVRLARRLINVYSNSFTHDTKITFMFDLFRYLRTFSYFIYDLPVSRTPFHLDIRDKNALQTILSEMVEQYNDKGAVKALFASVDKILDDTVYNEKVRSIVSYQIAQKISIKACRIDWKREDYYALFNDKSSLFNTRYRQSKQFDLNNILKVTFYSKDKIDVEKLLNTLNRKNHIKTGYYERIGSGGKTILVSLKSSCRSENHRKVAFGVLKSILSAMSQSGISASDLRYIGIIRYFLYYLLGEYPIKILPTIDIEKCVLVKRGRRARIKEINQLLAARYGTDDARHEIDFIKSIIETDVKNDLCVAVCGSVVSYQRDMSGKQLNEYDGLILYPNRLTEQIVFVESKNTKDSGQASKCLKTKLNNAHIEYDNEEIISVNKDCFFKYSIE